MRKIKPKSRLLLVAVLLLQLIVLPLHNTSADNMVDVTTPTWTHEIDYLALGDSLAAGMDPNGGMGNGYPDYLAQSIQVTGLLKSYNKGFSYPGYTTTNVLNDLETNVTKDVYGHGYKEKAVQLRNAIASAEIITISVGANDALAQLKVDPVTGEITTDQLQLLTVIQKVGVNTKAILSQIKQLNPNAQVYVMGYYNPFPQAAPGMQPLLAQLLQSLNTTIQSGMEETGAIFVPTADIIATDYATYLPNPKNIHLSEAGYKMVSEQFWTKIKTTYPLGETNSLTYTMAANSVTLNWKPAIDDVGVTGYDIYNGKEKIDTVDGNTLSYEVKNVVENTQYIFSVVAVDAAGNSSVQNPVINVTTTPITLFTDIAGHWAKEEIEKAVATGFVFGYADGTFKPENKLTRVQAASILVRALGLTTDEASPFKDISGYAAGTQADINAAYKYGLVIGDKGNFMPSKQVTQAEIALIIERAYTLKTGKKYKASKKAPYSDIGNYNKETINAISMLYELGIATGSEGKFNPATSTSRAQATKMLVTLIEGLK